jgi:hypothetical protein
MHRLDLLRIQTGVFVAVPEFVIDTLPTGVYLTVAGQKHCVPVPASDGSNIDVPEVLNFAREELVRRRKVAQLPIQATAPSKCLPSLTTSNDARTMLIAAEHLPRQPTNMLVTSP